MLFTEQFHITYDPSDDWLDPILTHDTRLFLDPFLIFQTDNPKFIHGHGKFIQFFNHVFELIAKSAGDVNSIYYRQALGLLIFPEVDEICLGFSQGTTKGLGSGNVYAKLIAEAIWNSINAGVKQISHFEELSIFNEGIGADRISDMTANLFKSELIKYTQEICQKYNIATVTKQVENTSYSLDYNRWNHSRVALPYNLYTKNPIILIPVEFLSPLPVINHDDFIDYVYRHENSILRASLSHAVKSKLKKEDIVALARANPATVARYVERKEKVGAYPYDLNSDRKGLYNWYKDGKSFVEQKPLEITPPANEEEFLQKVQGIVNIFKHFVEHEKGYELLRDDRNLPRAEKAVQRLFWSIVMHYCKANGIDSTAEVNLGSGPVDFRFSNGYEQRLLLEIKLANNTKLWNGLEKQLPQYLETEQIKNGIFLIVGYTRKELSKVNMDAVDKVNNVNDLVKHSGKNIVSVVIDASIKPSASRL